MTAGGSTKKLVLLLLVSFAATGSVVYQIRARRTVVRPPATARPQDMAPTPAAAAPTDPLAPVASPGAAPGAGSEAAILGIPGAPGAAISGLAATLTDIPVDAWGRAGRRNPFLSMEEAAALNRPREVAVNEPQVEAPPPQPSELPTYAVTAIIAGEEGNRAIVGARVLQPGDRLGRERVKEITERSVVLEYEGRTRELVLKRLQNDIRQLVVPRGD